jgi:hypothetical protein
MQDPRREPWMPFFIRWDIPAEEHPGRARSGHAVQVTGIAHVEVAGDPARLREWVGAHDLPIRFVAGPPGIVAVAIGADRGEIVLR